jgi:plasmid stabilization system protein ParE
VTLVIDLDAVADVEAAYLWYMRRDPLIAAKFRAAFNAAVARAVEQPESYEVLYRGARRVILHRFPYGVFYRIEGKTVVVIACMHLTRAPSAWRSRT